MYYVLWIPSLAPAQPEVKIKKVYRELKDVEEYEPCRLSSVISSEKCDVTLSYSLSFKEPFRSVEFKCIHRTHAGFIVYEYISSGGIDEVSRNLDKGMMHPAIYHIIKHHFHSHRFHDEECDSLLTPYSTKKEVNISNQSTMKDIYMFYLGQYRKKLDDNLNSLTQQYVLLREREKNNQFFTYLEDAKRIKEECEQANGEALYARSLLSMTRYSVKTQIYERITALSYDIDRLSTKCNDIYTLTNNRFNNRLGLWGIWVGAVGILLTVGLEVTKCIRGDGSDMYKEEYFRLKSRADSLNGVNQQIIEQYESYHSQENNN